MISLLAAAGSGPFDDTSTILLVVVVLPIVCASISTAAMVFIRDKRRNLGLSMFARSRIRKAGERASAVVLDTANQRFVVEVAPASGAKFRAEIGSPAFTRSDSDKERSKAFDREVAMGAQLHVFFLRGDSPAVIFDLDEIFMRGKAGEEAKRRLGDEEEAALAAAAEEKRQRLLRGEDP